MAGEKNLFDTFLLVLGGLVALALIILVFAQNMTGDEQGGPQDADAVAALEERIKPVGEVSVAGQEAAAVSEAAPVEEPAVADEASTDVIADAVADAAGEAADAVADAAEAIAAIDGQAIYNQACVACHAAGIAGAPKVGDTANWEPRLAQGIDVVYDHAINGYTGNAGMMPPKGGRMDLSDDEVRAAVDYMVDSNQ